MAIAIMTATVAVPISTFLVYRVWPQIQTLRSGRLHVYIGPLRDLAAFDAIHDLFRMHHSVGEHLNRYVEVLALGDGDRIWRVEGEDVKGPVRNVRSVRLALLPDLDESGTRALTREERDELALRISDFKRKGNFVREALLSTLMAYPAANAVGIFLPRLKDAVAILTLVVAMYVVWKPYVKRRKFAKVLQADLNAGFVQGGSLSSQLPWVVNGAPARWRTGRPRGGTTGVTTLQAMHLERDEEEDDPDEELVRQALAAREPEVLEERKPFRNEIDAKP